MYLEFDVRHQTISRTDEFEVVANSLHYLFARFTFSEEWEGKQQTAIFSMNNGTNISVLLTDGECEVPWEVLRGREFWVGVFAGDRITTTPVRVPVQASVNLNASPGVQPTPSAYELLVQRVEDALTKGPHIGPNDNWWVWDATVNDFVDTGVYSHGSSPRIVNGVWWVGDTDTGVAATGPKGDKGDKGDTGNKGDKGDKGDPGNNIQAITRTAGTGAPGTTDTYTVTLTDGSTTTFSVYNGADGGGAGDMTAIVYDPQGKKTDVFKAIDDAASGLLKNTGDTMKGNFFVERAAFPQIIVRDSTQQRDGFFQYAENGLLFLQNIPTNGDGNNRSIVILGNESTDDKDLLRVAKIVGGTWQTSKVYHENHKPTPKEVGAYPTPVKTISTLPTPTEEVSYFVDIADQTFPVPWGHLDIRYGSYTGEYVAIFKSTGTDVNIYYNMWKNGSWNGWEKMLHTGNLPVEAATAEIVE